MRVRRRVGLRLRPTCCVRFCTILSLNTGTSLSTTLGTSLIISRVISGTATCSSRSERVSETVVVGGAWSLRCICSRVGLLRAISSRVAGRDSVAGWGSCGCCCCSCRCSALGPRSPPTHTSMAVGCPASIAPAALMCSPCGLPLAR